MNTPDTVVAGPAGDIPQTPGPMLQMGGSRPPPTDTSMLMHIIERAANAPEFDLERLEKLLELKERWDANEAHKAFTIAMAEFKATPLKIVKNKHVHFKNKAGGSTEYDHATHSEVTEKIAAGLAAHGFSHRWNIEQLQDGKVHITCIVTHVRGHSEQVSMTAPPDDSGSKSPVQAIASTSTLLQRYTLLAVVGASTEDMPDADDRGSDVPELPVDVWTALGDASREGPTALSEAWKGLSDDTRAIIVLHFKKDWAELKAVASKVQ